MLGGVRVLDLANENGVNSTKCLANLGAEVIKVEPPQGDGTRFIAPFAGGEKHAEKSLFHAHHNGGKKSITLDYTKGRGKEVFLELVKESDVLVETSSPGTMESIGLDYESLKKINPKLIMCSITPFGQKGPYAKWNASSDIVPFALHGAMFEYGSPGREPLQMGLNMVANGAGLYAVVGILSSLYARNIDGVGDYLDISLSKVMNSWRNVAHGLSQYTGSIPQRTGAQGMFAPSNFFECKDGYVYLVSSGHWSNLIEWMKEMGVDIGDKDDPKYLVDMGSNKHLFEEIDLVNQMVNELTRQFTMQECVEEGQRRAIPFGSLETPETMLGNPHYKAREMFVDSEHPVIGSYKATGSPIKFSGAEMNTAIRAPLLGEHNEEIYVNAGLTMSEILQLKEQAVI